MRIKNIGVAKVSSLTLIVICGLLTLISAFLNLQISIDYRREKIPLGGMDLGEELFYQHLLSFLCLGVISWALIKNKKIVTNILIFISSLAIFYLLFSWYQKTRYFFEDSRYLSWNNIPSPLLRGANILDWFAVVLFVVFLGLYGFTLVANLMVNRRSK
jgi:hypothetical protein